MIATAPVATRWLLVEREGAWPEKAIAAFSPEQAHALSDKLTEHDARLALIRRPSRHPATHGPFRWAVADTRRDREGIRWQVAHSVEDIFATPWETEPGEGEPVALVCCHSKHDMCCAIRGRPVAQEVQAAWPGRVWESSHLGGDRFAASMVLLPSGLCYGRLDPATATAALHAHERGLLIPHHLRGRSGDSREVQAAAALARQAGLASERVDHLRPQGAPTTHDGITTVRFSAPDVAISFREREVDLGTPARCRVDKPGAGREYSLVPSAELSPRGR